MLAIKLAKVGKTNKKMFRLIISEKNRDPYGRVLEILGSYNPHSKELAVKAERVNYWLSQGAKMTPTVNNLLIEKKVVTGEKAVASKPGKPSEKRLGQIKAKADKKVTSQKAPAEEKEAEDQTPTETPAKAPVENKAEDKAEEDKKPAEETAA
jgi:small subunit ribosomal protein S16